MLSLIKWFKKSKKEPMKTSDKGIALIKEFEGCRLVPYLDYGGVPTVGYGHINGVQIGKRITQQQAEDFLREDLVRREDALNSYSLPLEQHQFDALISLIYNIGTGAFDRSTLLRKLKKNDFKGAADAFLSWHKVNGQPVAGLLKRRNAERRVFLGLE